MSSVAYTLAQKRVAAVQEVVEQWHVDHEESQFTSDVEELVAESASLLQPLQRLTHLFKTESYSENNADQLVTVHMVAFLLNEALRLFPKIDGLVNEVHHLGSHIRGLDQFDQSRAELARINVELGKKWPLPEERTVKAAKRDLTAGKFRIL